MLINNSNVFPIKRKSALVVDSKQLVTATCLSYRRVKVIVLEIHTNQGLVDKPRYK